MNCIYNENYLIYNDGRVYSKYKNKFLTPNLNKNNNQGYHEVSIKDYKKHAKIHRLVAIHYIPNPHNYDCVDHIDGNKLNNDVSNLRWCTRIQNDNSFRMINKNNKLGFKHISMTPNNTYKVQITRYGKKLIDNKYKTLNDALWVKFVILLRHKSH